MGAKGFILALLAVAAAGAGAGYGATFVFPPPEAPPPATSSLAPDSGGGGEAGDGAADGDAGQGDGDAAGGEAFSEEDLPEEVRQAMAEDPELAAQIRQAIESGQIPPGAFGPPGGADGGGGGSAPGFAGGGATPLSGTVLSYSDGTLRLDTADGVADVAVEPDTPVNVTMAPSEAGEYLAEGAEVTVAAQAGEAGALTALAVFAGGAPDELTGAPGLAAFVTIIAGTVESFTDGTLTVAGEDGSTEVATGEQTLVAAELTARDAAAELTEGASVTAFVERGADGGLEASSIEIGGAGGGFGGAPFGGGFGGGAPFGGGAAGQFPGADGLSSSARQEAAADNREARTQRRITRQALGTGGARG